MVEARTQQRISVLAQIIYRRGEFDLASKPWLDHMTVGRGHLHQSVVSTVGSLQRRDVTLHYRLGGAFEHFRVHHQKCQHRSQAGHRNIHGPAVHIRQPEKRRHRTGKQQQHADAAQRREIAAQLFEPSRPHRIGRIARRAHGQQDAAIDVGRVTARHGAGQGKEPGRQRQR